MGLYDDDPQGPPEIPPFLECEMVDYGWGFRFTYPSSWRISRDNQGSFVIIKPLPDAAENVNVIMRALNYVPTIEQYASIQLANLRSEVPCNILNRGFVKLADVDGYQVMASFSLSGKRFKSLQVHAIDGNVGYTLTYLAPEDVFSLYEPVVWDIIKSFTLIRP